ncbi:TIGR04282 family arsenosugar biosynthesis glycosyltransferase [Oleisolibacter albus]|uniref:TIGR04282 family arsenosugar biosynthesis glycosyltransferase n=1 Tax=Oleisolibacter albus TaxID=2171757 RepID=UPI000DF3A9CD|nr:TIGR04282 family arsenosugar biosynthesis glycosyltransferase [Oleisolibacter albus]
MNRPTLIVLAKAPMLGRVKRRLARGLGEAQALRFYRACLAGTLRRLGGDPRWDRVLAVAPDRLARRPAWPAGWTRGWRLAAQGDGDLGRLMLRQLAAADGPCVLIGGDIPGITPAQIARALAALRRADAVFGPSADGGYWLIGLKRPPRRLDLLDGVRWSSPHALADSMRILGLHSILTDRLADVDEAADYRAWIRGR